MTPLATFLFSPSRYLYTTTYSLFSLSILLSIFVIRRRLSRRLLAEQLQSHTPPQIHAALSWPRRGAVVDVELQRRVDSAARARPRSSARYVGRPRSFDSV
ncbi:hypothetical protein TeGR_g13138 [Tetraparma gracilis]|uniref:ATP synthase F0 subunit 8 n=1 Tax=Tetraparma gracilis TaxID=2962635 RepID=A0ABQ6MJ70_9STRA|nr:hypothetical protein TeGR_g13138 [Tetraparma gracilis]